MGCRCETPPDIYQLVVKLDVQFQQLHDVFKIKEYNDTIMKVIQCIRKLKIPDGNMRKLPVTTVTWVE